MMAALEVVFENLDGGIARFGPFASVNVGQVYLYGFALGAGKRTLARRRDEGGWQLFGAVDDDGRYDRVTVADVTTRAD